MGVADKHRRGRRPEAPKPKEPAPASSDYKPDPFDILLDGCFPRTIGEEKVAYIPLTLAEELEVSDPESATFRMIAKAFKYRLDKGLDTFDSLGLNRSKSLEENAKDMLDELPETTRRALVLSIQLDIADRLKSFVQFYERLHEEYKKPDDDGPKRESNDLDPFVMVLNNFRETGYTVADMAEMTQLQYQAFTMIRYEANIRQANDHTDKSERIKSKAAAGKGNTSGKPKRQLVGS